MSTELDSNKNEEAPDLSYYGANPMEWALGAATVFIASSLLTTRQFIWAAILGVAVTYGLSIYRWQVVDEGKRPFLTEKDKRRIIKRAKAGAIGLVFLVIYLCFFFHRK